MYAEILRYMGYTGAADIQMETLISSCLEKLAPVCEPRHVIRRYACTAAGGIVTIDTLKIKSEGLSAHLCGCTQAYLLAATLGAEVDRLIAQRSTVDSAEALCLQACAVSKIEDYCSSIERELSQNISGSALHLRARFSPGYSDFDIAHQTDLLNMLTAHKLIGVAETKSHMLTPLKSVTAVIGVCSKETARTPDKCKSCGKTGCSFKQREVSS